MSSSSYFQRGTKFQTRWYENNTSQQRVEYKTKLVNNNYIENWCIKTAMDVPDKNIPGNIKSL